MVDRGTTWDHFGIPAIVLSPLALLYAAGWLAYEGVYRLGLKRPYPSAVPVICAGNLTVGGSGKTPLVIHLAEVLEKMGWPVAISCNGYGSPASREARLAPDGPVSAEEWGDEAALLRWELPAVPLVVGRDRVRAAKLVEEAFPGAALLLDDGFQHLPLRKDVSIVLDPPRPNRLCLPAGPYREPRSTGFRRADVVLPGEFELVRHGLEFVSPEGERAPAPPADIDVLCAIGQPQRFLYELDFIGFTLHEQRILRDHDPLRAGNLLRGLGKGRTLVVTAKDWMKLRERDDLGDRRIAIARYRVSIEPRERFRSWLAARVHEAKPTRHRR